MLAEGLEPDSVGTTESLMTAKLFAIHAKSLRSVALHKMQPGLNLRYWWSIGRDGERPLLRCPSNEDGEYISKCMPMYHAASWELSQREIESLGT